ncbi:hypothetical protein KM885_06880 [Oceanobacillus caeni]|nr:hypothetical protein [Oceanobacillus caeni]MBU8790516.1 hypothetical protein [Oceanobacillus caeni]
MELYQYSVEISVKVGAISAHGMGYQQKLELYQYSVEISVKVGAISARA